MKYPCPNCGQRLESGASIAGERIECPACGKSLVTPAAAKTPAAPDVTMMEADATPADAPPVDESGATIVEHDATRQSAIHRSEMTISGFMAEHGLDGGGVNLDSAGSSAAQMLNAEDGRRYDMGEVVAEGGMGAIIDARDRNLRRSVAMKVLHNPGKATRSQLLRFIEEAQVTAQLQHPGIVPTHELGVDASGNPFYTMKMIRGQTLRAILEQIQAGDAKTIEQYPLPRLLTVFQRVCDAMAFSHSKRVIHRDLKPENIMVGEYGETLVMDWGLAKVLPKKDWRKKGGKPSAPVAPIKPITVVESIRSDKSMSGNGVKTMDGMVMGTPQFMAPEQAQGEIEKLDDRTDVYSLGAILYSILTLHPPISGNDIDEMLKNVSQGNIPHPCTYQAGKLKTAGAGAKAKPARLAHCPGGRIPEALIAVALKAMALQPSDRYPRVIELQRDIEAYQTGFAVSVEQASVWRQMTLLVGRNKGLFTGLGVAAGLIVLLTAGFVMRVNSEKQQALASEQRALASEDKALLTLYRLKETVPVFIGRSRLQMDNHNFEEALETLEPAMELAPDNVALWRQRGDILQNLLRLDEAAEAYRRILALDASDRHAKDNITICETLLRFPVEDGQVSPQWVTALADHFYLHGRTLEAGAMQSRMRGDKEQLWMQWEPVFRQTGLKGGLSQDDAGGFILTLDPSVDDLSPMRQLRGMPLVSLNLGRTGVVDLSPLQGMPLQSLNLLLTRVADLSPLKGMPLQSLTLQQTGVTDLSPLQGMPLQGLNLQQTGVTDLTPLRDMPLQLLDLQSTRVTDLSPLHGMPLQSLNLQQTSVTDLSPLQGMPLQSLNLQSTGVTDLSPLRGMHLTWLNLAGSHVIDLSLVRGMPLQHLNVGGCRVSDLTPLLGLPLKQICIAGSKVVDVTPLAESPLHTILFTPSAIKNGMDVLRFLPSLAFVQPRAAMRISAAEFWQRYDAGEFNEP